MTLSFGMKNTGKQIIRYIKNSRRFLRIIMKKKPLILCLIFNFLIFTSIFAYDVKINSLNDLTMTSLKKRNYFSNLIVEKRKVEDNKTIYLSYLSDSIKTYVKVQVPNTKEPVDGYPVIIIAHGKVEKNQTSNWDFGDNEESFIGNLSDKYSSLGYVVLIPGYRGHGTINDEISEGLEYLYAYDNKSYLISTFYAIDVVNLIEGIGSLKNLKIKNEYQKNQNYFSRNLNINLNELYLTGYGQGGDVTLTVLGIIGGNTTKNKIKAASIWSGSFADIDTKVQNIKYLDRLNYKNPNNFEEEDFIRGNYKEMYNVFNHYIRDLTNTSFSYDKNKRIIHDKRVSKYIKNIGCYNLPNLIKTPVIFHFSNSDEISQEKWNYRMVKKLRKNNIESTAYEYKGNTPQLEIDKTSFNLYGEIRGGFNTAIRIDDLFFNREEY